jgi:hypothetical protein
VGVPFGASERATAQLLWDAARPQPSIDAIRAALDDGADVTRTAALAQGHGIGPLLWRALGLAQRQDRINPAGGQLEREAQVRRAEALLLLPHAVAASVGPLRSKGFEPVVFKGPSLASRYPEPGLRSMVDIDLILPSADHPAAVGVLVGAGWEVARVADRRHYDTILVHPLVPGLFLELHRGLDMWFERSTAVRAEELWERRVPVDCMGTPAFGLPPEVELLALAAHAGKPYHCFSRLIWIVDLVVVVDAVRAEGREVDWDLVRELARTWRCQTVLAVALAQGNRLGLGSPAELTRVTGSSLRRSALAALFAPDWPLALPDMKTRNRLRYALADNWPRRAVLFAGSPAPEPLKKWPGRYLHLLAMVVPGAWRLWRGDRAVSGGDATTGA